MRRLIVTVLVGCSAQSTLGYLQPPPSREHRLGLGGLDRALASELEREYRAKREQPPVSLVPTDGSELVLKRLRANVQIAGPLAHTELHFTFHNPEGRTREGRFAITLPPSAAVTAFSMKVNGKWREARVVARDRGREVYETFLHRRVDPALLEQDLGNQFSARVFPIAANEDKEITITYDHEVVDNYTLALRGMPKIEDLSVTIDNNGERRSIGQHASAPEDISVDVVRGAAAIEYGESFVARVNTADAFAPAAMTSVLYLVDTSASRAPVMGKQAELLQALLAAHGPQDTVAIATFDQKTEQVFRGFAQYAMAAPSLTLQHGALGVSNLGSALARAASTGMKRVVIIGDAAATAGESDRDALAAHLRDTAIERVDVVQVGQSIDRLTAQRLVAAGPQRGFVIDGRDPARVVRVLSTAALPPEKIVVDGAKQTWPPTTRDLVPGEPVFVYGLRTTAGPLVVRVGDTPATVTPGKGHTRLRRAVARAELAELIATNASSDKIEDLALTHRLVSPQTSLIVLETDADERAMLGDNDEYVRKTRPAITPDYTRNIPTGRTFEQVLRAAAGSQGDSYGISFSGSTSLENVYYVDGINITGLTFGTVATPILNQGASRRMAGWASNRHYIVRADVMSPLAFDHHARSIQANALWSTYTAEATPPEPTYAQPYTGKLREVMKLVAKRDPRAVAVATAWQVANPGDVAAIMALGEALEAAGAGNLAIRAYSSIADLYPNRAELLRAAGERLDRIPAARLLSLDLYRRALKERPDHVTTYRLLAYALVRANRPEEALDVILEGAKQTTRSTIQAMLADDAAIIGTHIVARHPARRYDIEPKLPHGFATHATTRFVLMWETDATDVDLHVRDRHDRHASWKRGDRDVTGSFFEDMRDGWGPEMFLIDRPKAFPYKLSAHYHTKGAMGLGLGTVQVIHHDGAGGIRIEDRPFVIQNDNAMVELGTITAGAGG